MGAKNRSCPSKKRVKEKGHELLQRHLLVLEIYVIIFPPQAPHKARRHHLSHDNTPRMTTRPPSSKQINYSST
jgi:hypothetical protein